MKAIFLFPLLLFLTLAAASPAAVIAGYDFGAGTTFSAAPSTEALHTTSTNMANGSLLTFEGFIDDYTSAPVLKVNPGTSGGLGSTSSLAAAFTNNNYFTFSVTVESGYMLNLSSLTFQVAKGGGSSPRGWYLYSSIDGFTSDQVVGQSNVVAQRASFETGSVTLTDARFQELTGTTEFRVYIVTPSTGSSLEFDDFALNGEVVAVPETGVGSGLALGLAGAYLFPRTRRRWN